MFGGVTNLVLSLGILLCPLHCVEGVDVVADATPSQCSDDCCGCGRDSSADEGGENGPGPCHDGCGRDCVCKGLLRGQVNLLLTCVDFGLSSSCQHGVAVAVPASLAISPEAVRTRGPTHPELASGAAIRLAFASLLI